jgi:hypothetical protein
VKADLYQLSFDGAFLARGFWLYIWEIAVSDGRTLHYVGKTGDEASGASQSPFDRLSRHLGHNQNNNALRRHLGKVGIDPECCSFRFHAYGPLFVSESRKTHAELCDITSGLEKALAEAMAGAGYTVINTINSCEPADLKLFALVRNAFASHFKDLASDRDSRRSVVPAGEGR